MAVAPNNIADANLRFTVKANGSAIKDAYPVISVDIAHELNKISTASVVLIDGEIEENDFPISDSADLIPGVSLEITAGYGDDAETSIFSGIIVKHSLELSESGNRLIITAKHKAVGMTFNRTEAEFTQKKDSDIISSIIGSYSGLSATVDASTVQYEGMYQKMATDWDFVLSRAEFLGYVIAMDGDSITVGKPKFSASAALTVSAGDSIRAFRAEVSAERQATSVTANAWDAKTLALVNSASSEPTVSAQGNISGSTLSSALSQKALTLNSGTMMTTEELKVWADSNLLRMRMAAMKGEVTFMGSALAKTNSILELTNVGARFNGNAYISAVLHAMEEGEWETTVRFGLDDTPLHERLPVSYSPAFGMLPAVNGLQLGTVKQLASDPDSQFRVMVTVASSASSPVTLWARMASYYATAAAGAVFMPEIGDEVILGYLESDPRFPIILGSLYSSKNASPSPASDENNYTKMLMTKAKLKVTFDDEKKNIIIETPGANKITLSDDQKSIEIADQNNNTVKMTSSGINLQSAKDITLKATGNIELNATGKVNITATQDAVITGMNVTNTAQMGFTAKGNTTAELSASGQTTVKGAIVMIN